MSLKEYRRKRDFTKTPEPAPRAKSRSAKGHLRFVVQKHDATRTHYDFRIEVDGAFKSWAVPKGPTLTSQDPRLAVRVEDHPLEYGDFEGVIPKGNYGAGTVMIWDRGTFVERASSGRADSEAALKRGLEEGHVTLVLDGEKLRGEFALVKVKKRGAEENAWLLIKKHDAAATRVDVQMQDRSAKTGRTMEQIAKQAVAKGEIWLPRQGTPSAGAAPKRARPMEPVFAPRPPTGPEWIFEAFGEGTRAIAEVEGGRVRLHSRALLPLEKRYPKIVARLAKLRHDAVLDGEIVGQEFRAGDLLFLDGKDLRERPLRERKKQLARLKLPAPGAPDGAAQIVAKRADSPYRGGLTRDWLRFRPAAEERPPLTHPEKPFFPEDGYTKGDLVKYYDSIAEIILPYLVDRPQSLHRQPDGIRNEGFFHKDMTSFLPRRIQTIRIHSGSSGRTINYALCQDRWSLLYLVNLGCIELNPWLSRKSALDRPDLVVIDLDPDGNSFDEVVKVAREVHAVLKKAKVPAYAKTSGSSGLHICIPTAGSCNYDTGRAFAEAVCRIVQARLPKLTSVERNPAKRRGRIYLDFLQNRRAQTLAAPYCVRPRPGATVSAPLKWTEVKPGLDPAKFTIATMAARLKKVGDLWKPMLTERADLAKALARINALR